MRNRKVIHMNDEQIGSINQVLHNSRGLSELAAGKIEDTELPGISGVGRNSSVVVDDDAIEVKSDSVLNKEEFMPVFKEEAMAESNDDWFNSDFSAVNRANQDLKQELLDKEKLRGYQEMQKFRRKLPAYKMRHELVKMINSNQVLVISGETGCGKTTQVPQFILDDAIVRGQGSQCKIVCTQPRRISAISIAERVARERSEACGGESCGYQIRLQNRLPRSYGSILYCTTGILIQRLHNDSLLKNISHVVLDEIHERDLHSDFILTIVKDIVEKRKNIRIVLMSATLNAEMFSEYFNTAPCFHIPGFTFPVEDIYLEEIVAATRYRPNEQVLRSMHKVQRPRGRANREKIREENEKMDEQWDEYESEELQGKYSSDICNNLHAMHSYLKIKIDFDLVIATLRYITMNRTPGAVLIFVPGWTDIKVINEKLTRDAEFSSSRYCIIPLHSMMPTVNQQQVFNPSPEGVTKIVIATNIAETSITIDDIVHVIDTGKIKQSGFDPDTNMGSLQVQWISRANARQRRGRAGRVQEGFCYRLYTKLQEKEFDDYLLPEMLRTPLDQLCLQIKALKLGKIEEFLSRVMEPPSVEAVNLSISKLTALNALDSLQNLTPLGYHLSRLPVEPQIGKMILLGSMFSCLDPVLTIAANLSFKDPFCYPLGKEQLADKKRKEIAGDYMSDHLMYLNAFHRWETVRCRGYREESDFCWRNFLSSSTLRMIFDMKKQFAEHLHHIGFSPSADPKNTSVNELSHNLKVVMAIVCAGLYPNVAKIQPKKPFRPPKLSTKTERSVVFHPKSVHYDVKSSMYKDQWLCYYLKMKSTSIFIHDASEVSAFPLLFFGGEIKSFYDKEVNEDMISVDDWIVFKSKPNIANLVKELRHELDRILEEKIKEPNTVEWKGRQSTNSVLSSIVDLITTEI